MNARMQRLRCAQDTAVFPEESDCPVKSGALLIYLSRCFDKITFTYLFMLVILSSSDGMSRGTSAPNPKDYQMVMYSGDSS